ncbi:MAG: thioredoxin family protein [Anaerolineae bacterium]|nr:thioredoxin family protein [Anaerolineae bacterium]
MAVSEKVLDRNTFDAKALPTSQKATSFTMGLTFEEFLQESPHLELWLRKRLGEVRIPQDDQTYFVTYPEHLNFLILLSEDAPETLVVTPVLVRALASCPRCLLQIVRDTDDVGPLARLLEEQGLTGVLSDIEPPTLFVFDDEWNYRGQWGPHPQGAEPYLDEWFVRYPAYEILADRDDSADLSAYVELLEQLTHEMRVWYNSGLNQACVREVRMLMASLLAEDDELAGEDETLK